MEKVLLQVESWGVKVSESQERSLLEYARELAGYEKVNVIGTRVVGDILLNHVLDSLSCLAFKPLKEADSLVDVGSGGGLPGIPLKAVLPELSAALLESTGKKAEFLSYVVEELELDRVEILKDRAEDIGDLKRHRGKYDIATIRAVARLDVNCEYCVPLLREGGYMISMKSSLDEAEIVAGEKAARLLGAEVSEIIPVTFLPDLPDKKRNLVIVRKFAATPNRYPRKKGTPKKKPLGAGQNKQ